MRPIFLLALLAAVPAALAQPATGHGAACMASGASCSADSTVACPCPMNGEAGAHGDHAMHAGMDHAAMHGPATHGAAETAAHQAVRGVIVGLFDAMRAGDGAALLAGFHEGATLTSVGADRDGVLAARREGIEGFAEAVGTPHPEPYDERIGPIEVRVDGPLATAWMTYRFHVGERFSHCGVNSFQLADVGEGWKILAVTDTRRTECPETAAE